MKVRMTWNFDDNDRRAIARQVGREGKASHEDCLVWIQQAVEFCLIQIVVPDALDQAIADAQARSNEKEGDR